MSNLYFFLFLLFCWKTSFPESIFWIIKKKQNNLKRLFAPLRNTCIYFAESVNKKIYEKIQTCHWLKMSPSGALLVHLCKCIYKRVKMLGLYVCERSDKMWEKHSHQKHQGHQWMGRGRKGWCVCFCFISHSHNAVTINSKISNWFPQMESVLLWWQLAGNPPVLSCTHEIFIEFSPPGPLGRGSDRAAWWATHHNNLTKGFKVPLIKDFLKNFLA